MREKRVYALFGAILLFLLITSFPRAHAQDTSGISGLFGEKASAGTQEISPPFVPSEGDQGKFDVALELKDITTKEPIAVVHINLEVINKATGERYSTLKYVDESGILLLSLAPGDYEVIIKADLLGNTGNDYYLKEDINVAGKTQEPVYLLPVGSVRGIVINNATGEVVRDADVKFECASDYGEAPQQKTDSFGSFSSMWLPAGICRISASSGSRVGFSDVEIKKGQLENATIYLNKRAATGWIYYAAVFLALAVFAFLFSIFAYKMKRAKEIQEGLAKKDDSKKKKIGELELELKEERVKQRSTDIMKTLNEKERLVVKSLIDNHLQSTQAKLKYSTGIPKTSLCRVFDSLEKKRIIEIEKIGKMKKIRLTEWFLGKD